jgi:hypothetical protein
MINSLSLNEAHYIPFYSTGTSCAARVINWRFISAEADIPLTVRNSSCPVIGREKIGLYKPVPLHLGLRTVCSTFTVQYWEYWTYELFHPKMEAASNFRHTFLSVFLGCLVSLMRPVWSVINFIIINVIRSSRSSTSTAATNRPKRENDYLSKTNPQWQLRKCENDYLHACVIHSEYRKCVFACLSEQWTVYLVQ